jgi:hypothetical protein
VSADDGSDWAVPAFKPDAALVTVQRALRDLKLGSRSGGLVFELRGKTVMTLELSGPALKVRMARKPQLTPEWDSFSVDSATTQRKLLDEVKKRLARWEQED